MGKKQETVENLQFFEYQSLSINLSENDSVYFCATQIYGHIIYMQG